MLALHKAAVLCSLVLRVASCWSIADGAVAVAGSGDAGERVAFERLTGPVELVAGRTLDIAFKVPEAPPLPHQVAVRLVPSGAPAGSLDKTVLSKPRQKHLQTTIPFKQIPRELQNQNLDVVVYISGGDSAPFTSKLFDLYVYSEDGVSATGSPVEAAGSGSRLAPLPEIVYTRRADPRHVNPVIALVFVGAIDILFGAWLLSTSQEVGALSAVLSGFSASKSLLVLAVGAMELLFVAYYVSWSIFRVISVSAVVLPIAYLAGAKAL